MNYYGSLCKGKTTTTKKVRRSFPRPFTNSITEQNCCKVKPWIFRHTCTDAERWTNICGGAALRAYPSIPIIRKNPLSMTSAKCLSMSAARHFEGLAALSARSAGRRAAVRAGKKPGHFSFDGCPLFRHA